MAELVTEWRVLTGCKDTSETEAATIRKWINSYYTENFPFDSNVDELNGFLTQAVSATDSGEYTLAQTALKIKEPVTLNGEPISLYLDKKLFFETYLENEQYISAPGLAIGESDTKKVKHDDFSYAIAGNSHGKSSSEVAFSGLDTVPQNKYGAFSLTIDSDGTITINQAGGNSIGYDTPALAIAALEVAGSDDAYMGYVTVISTDSGGFVPGTTELNDSAVTDTYTDGQPANRNAPEAVCQYGNTLYVRPRSDDIYQIKFPYRKRPEAIDEGAPLDVAWGPVIATGAAMAYLARIGETVKRDNLIPLMDYRLRSINSKARKRNQNRYTRPSF